MDDWKQSEEFLEILEKTRNAENGIDAREALKVVNGFFNKLIACKNKQLKNLEKRKKIQCEKGANYCKKHACEKWGHIRVVLEKRPIERGIAARNIRIRSTFLGMEYPVKIVKMCAVCGEVWIYEDQIPFSFLGISREEDPEYCQIPEDYKKVMEEAKALYLEEIEQEIEKAKAEEEEIRDTYRSLDGILWPKRLKKS